jgi:hypothetical protein
MAIYPFGYDNCAACGERWPKGQEVCANCQALPGESDVDRSLRLAEEDAAPAPFQIVLTFEDADTLRAALEYVGDSDAPVMIDDASSVTVDGTTYALWSRYDGAMAQLAELLGAGE